MATTEAEQILADHSPTGRLTKAAHFSLSVGPRFQHVSSYGPGGLNELNLGNVSAGHVYRGR
jgi:hypothetical protein